MSKQLIGIVALLFVGIGAVFAWNHVTLQQPLNRAISGDPRNAGIEARAHFGNFYSSDELIFDLKAVSSDKAPADVFRVLLQFAESQKGRYFAKVILAYRGTPKFLLDGLYFQELGQEYGSQNPVFTMRTFPEHARHPDGSEAFGTWTGGVLGVVKEQMEDFAEFHKQWYMAGMTSSNP